MNLWIFHHYATLPSLNGAIRPFRFAQQLQKENIHTTVFSSSYQHFSGKNLISDKARYVVEEAEGIPFVFVRTPDGSHGLSRIRNMLTFGRNLLAIAKPYARSTAKPDIIIASSPHPFSMLAGIRIAKKFKVPCICEVRDLWPEAIFCVSRIKENSLLGKMLIKGEHWIYRHADALIFTKEGDTDYLKERGWTTEQGGDIDLQKCFYINNGINLEEYLQQIHDFQIADEDLEDDSFKVTYAGTIRPVNDVGTIVDAAKLLPADSNIKFLIYGDGSLRKELEERVEQEHITNVKFKGFVEKKYLPYILSKSSVNLLNYSDKKYNWTRGNSSNKLFEYLASGKPVISTVKLGYSIIERYGCGLELSHHSPENLLQAVLTIQNMDEDSRKEMSGNAAAAAKEFDYQNLSARLISVIGQLCPKEQNP